jgi:potassium-transporting ATPase KdpC subunit
MLKHIRACLFLLVVTVILCCVAYPAVLLGIGKLAFAQKAEGSLLERKGAMVGSKLIAQPFGEKYFQPRPSAASYNAAASGASNWSGNNYLLRDRVARQLGTIVKYAGGDKKGQLVGQDVETWFQKGRAGIVEQWASSHSAVAQAWLHDWVKADPLNAAYVADWEAKHPEAVAKWKSDANNPDPKPEDLAAGIAVEFFSNYSKDHRISKDDPKSHLNSFPGVNDEKTTKTIGPVERGSDIQSLFFDMWLTEHADVELEKVPADMVTASGSGLDPDITLQSAEWQLEHFPIAAAWAKSSGRGEATVRAEIRKLLQENKSAPLGGLAGVDLVNVLELNLALQEHFGKPAEAK